MKNKKPIDVIGMQLDLGAPRRGVSIGPFAIRYAGLIENLTSLGYEVLDKGDIVSGNPDHSHPRLKNLKPIVEANGQLYDSVTKTLESNRFPVVLGGDHSLAAGSVSAVVDYYSDIGVIWVDAHGDFNDEASTESGNMHGMSFSAVTGQGPNEMVSFKKKPYFVNPKKSVLIAARDLDREERKRLKLAGVNVFSMHAINELGMGEVTRQAIALASEQTQGIYVSFDLDSIDPKEAPGAGIPVDNGLTAREAFLFAELLHSSGKLLGLDMVEVNPILDEKNKTANLASSLILSLLGQSLY